MKVRISTTIFFLLLCCSAAGAQSVSIQSDNIAWSINGMTDVNAGVTVPYQCKFVTRGTQNVDWVQDNGNFVLHFSVAETTGDWNDPVENGSVTFTIDGEGLNGQLTISKTTSGLAARLQLSGGTNEINHTYPVQSYEKL